jgi:hypothetical protein
MVPGAPVAPGGNQGFPSVHGAAHIAVFTFGQSLRGQEGVACVITLPP